jgi:DNA-directed RNA polymerase specialized sigma24 family protein
MSKFYRASIIMDIYPDENGLMEWEDEDHTPRTEEDLLDFARSELLECLFNGLKYNEIADMITVEVVEDDR